MQLVIIHGPEASGKLTVAKALQHKTSYKLFHNHLSIDVTNALFEYGEPGFDDLSFAIRLLVFEAAAKQNLAGVVFTWAYTDPQCRDMHTRIVDMLATYDCDIRYVFLDCLLDERKKRVVQRDRSQARKINTVEQLNRQLERKNCIPIPNVPLLKIDNTQLSAESAADEILSYLNTQP